MFRLRQFSYSYKHSFFLSKASEGADFRDASSRCVVVIGLPYPLRTDPKISVKQKYIEEVAKKVGSGSGAGSEWYTQVLVAVIIIGYLLPIVALCFIASEACISCCRPSRWTCDKTQKRFWSDFSLRRKV